jgi:dienelactone hydrolase
MIRRWAWGGLLGVFLASPAVAETAFQEIRLSIPMTDGSGNQLQLAGKLCLPQGAVRPRVVLHNHGRGNPPSQQVTLGCDSEPARWYLARGFAIAFMLRRGYGATGGRIMEDPSECRGQLGYAGAALEGARDIEATVNFLSVLPQLRPDGMVVQGHSAGGFATIAFSVYKDTRVAALVNFAGGRICGDLRSVLTAAGILGASSADSTVPMLWLYAANDFWWPPGAATSLHNAYTRAGGKAEYRGLPAYGKDRTEGHDDIVRGTGSSVLWGPVVEAYLKARGVMGPDGRSAP